MSNLISDIYSAKSEYNTRVKDKLGRTLSGNALHNPLTPVVSEHLYKNGFAPEYPGRKNFCCCVSHDLDTLITSTRSNKAFPVYRGGLKNTAYILWHEVKSQFRKQRTQISQEMHPERVLALADEMSFRSSYYTLALEAGERDHNYNLNEVSDILIQILSQGHEIGLHGGHEAYLSVKKLKEEKSRLTAHVPSVKGYRNHYLRFKVPHTWHYLREIGFEYDTSYGFHDCVGFRNGMCHPFRPFDLGRNAYIDLVVVPLVVMDSSLVKYMNLNFDDALEVVKGLIDKIKAVNGVFTILWHNTMFHGELLDFFKSVISYVQEQDPWMATTGELVDHFRSAGYLNEMEKILKLE